MKKLITLLLFIPVVLKAQDDLKVKTGSFDYEAYGKTYEYRGEYVISKESGSKEKLPHGKGTLKQPEKLDDAIKNGDKYPYTMNSEIEKFKKKGYAAEPYLYDGEWHMGEKHGIGEEKKYVIEKENPVIQEHYQGGYENDKFNGKGTHKTLKFKYTGDFKAGKRNGQGEIQIGDPLPPTALRLDLVKVKEKYEGSWKEDMFHGKGTFTSFEKKESFTGEFENHAFQKGLYTYKDGNTYDGEWQDGLPSGKGAYTWKKTGDVYVGEFTAGEPKGQGKLTKKDGSYFEGVFADGDCTGKAKMDIKSKYYQLDLKYIEYYGTYEGNITKSIPNGLGTFKSMKNVSYTEYDDEGEKITKQVPAYTYTGEWKDGVKYGAGKLETYTLNELVESLEFEGNFKDDKFDGDKGILKDYYSYGSVQYSGSFKSGQFNGYGRLESSGEGEGYNYEGQFIKGEFHGEGVYHVENGMGSYTKKGTFQNGFIIQGVSEYFQDDEKPVCRYTGSFSNGIEHGNGKIEYFGKFDEDLEDWSKNKVKSYEGDWAKGEPNGQGTMVYKDGTKITGNFRNGEYVKPFSPPSVKIGNQTWMSQNLTVTTFRNGDPLPEVKTKAEWEKAGRNGQPAFCYYNNDPSTAKTHGVLYNYYAVNDSRGLAPEGWRVPSHNDVDILSKHDFPSLSAEINSIYEKKSQGIKVESAFTEIIKKYTTNPNTTFSVKNLETRKDLYPCRDDFGDFKQYDHYNKKVVQSPSFWTSSYYDESNGVKFMINKADFLKILNYEYDMYGNWNGYKFDVTYPIRCEKPTSKGYGFSVRLIKDN